MEGAFAVPEGKGNARFETTMFARYPVLDASTPAENPPPLTNFFDSAHWMGTRPNSGGGAKSGGFWHDVPEHLSREPGIRPALCVERM
jgi:hypothetical protein